MEETIMSVIQAINTGAAQRRTIIDVARDLGPSHCTTRQRDNG